VEYAVGAREALGDLPRSALCLLLLERVDELDGGEEADLLAVMLDSLDAERRRDVAHQRLEERVARFGFDAGGDFAQDRVFARRSRRIRHARYSRSGGVTRSIQLR
jgi:hypothetical protein